MVNKSINLGGFMKMAVILLSAMCLISCTNPVEHEQRTLPLISVVSIKENTHSGIEYVVFRASAKDKRDLPTTVYSLADQSAEKGNMDIIYTETDTSIIIHANPITNSNYIISVKLISKFNWTADSIITIATCSSIRMHALQ